MYRPNAFFRFRLTVLISQGRRSECDLRNHQVGIAERLLFHSRSLDLRARPVPHAPRDLVASLPSRPPRKFPMRRVLWAERFLSGIAPVNRPPRNNTSPRDTRLEGPLSLRASDPFPAVSDQSVIQLCNRPAPGAKALSAATMQMLPNEHACIVDGRIGFAEVRN